jgi:hypothetical protein
MYVYLCMYIVRDVNNANGDNTVNTINIAYPGYCWIARHCEDVRVAIISASDRPSDEELFDPRGKTPDVKHLVESNR